MGKSRGPGRPRGRTEKGDETAAHVYAVATRLFAERGYAGTTLRAIAREAGVSPGLLYRYFPSKAAVVTKLYGELSGDFARRSASVAPGGWFPRYLATLRLSLESLADHRAVLQAVMPVMMMDRELGLFSARGAAGRQQVRERFVAAVMGADNAPVPSVAGPLARLLDYAHLGVILFWLMDRSEDTRATAGLLDWLGGLGGAAAAVLWLPGVARSLVALDGLFHRALVGDPVPAEADAP